MNYDLAKWATEARKAAGMTQEDFALELGFSTKASVNAIEKGRNKPTFETMVKISEISGFPLPYQAVSQIKVPSEDLDGLADDRIRFERLDVIASLGDGYVNNETAEVVDYVHVDKAWAREKLGGNLSRIQVITARGDSMQGTIEDGDVLFVDTSVRWFEGEGVYLLSFADGLKAKRLQASVGGGLLVISDNPRYRTETVEGDKLEKLTICGRVRGVGHLSGF